VRLPGDARVAPVARLFSEEPTRVVVSFAPDREAAIRMICVAHGVPLSVIGEVGGNELVIEGAVALAVGELGALHHGALDAIVGS